MQCFPWSLTSGWGFSVAKNGVARSRAGASQYLLFGLVS